MRKKSINSTLWIITYFIGTIFQYWRGSQTDTLVFATVAALLLLASQNILEIPKLKEIGLKTSIFVLFICTLAFVVFRIHSMPSTAFYLLLVPLLLMSMWRNDTIEVLESTPALRRSSWIWFAVGVLTCLAELGNYFAADATHNDRAYPTITVLVDPFVADNVGKIFFIILWSMIGVGLLRVSEKK